MGRPNYSAAEDDRLIALAMDGLSSSMIGKVLGRSGGSVLARTKSLRRIRNDNTIRCQPMDRSWHGQTMKVTKDYWPIPGHETIPWHIVITGRDQSIAGIRE